MKEDTLLFNARVILEELQLSTVEYLQSLSKQEYPAFIRDWNELRENAGPVSTVELLKKIDQLIDKYPTIRNQFNATSSEEISLFRFNPNEVSPTNQEVNYSIEIRNEVISAINTVADLLSNTIEVAKR